MLRDYLSDTALSGCWCLNTANWVRYSLPCFLSIFALESMRSGVAIPPPHKKGISAILARYPVKTRQNACETSLYDTISKGIARKGGGILLWAAKCIPELGAQWQSVAQFARPQLQYPRSRDTLQGSSRDNLSAPLHDDDLRLVCEILLRGETVRSNLFLE